MEVYDDEYLDQFISAKFIGIGAAGASASDYFSEVGNDLFPERLIVSNEDDVADLQAKIARVDYLFVITDIEDLKIAESVAKIIEESKVFLTTFGILCPSAFDVRLADILKNFGTWIVLPEDKIAESGLTKNAVIYRAVNMTTSIIPVMKKRANLIGMDFVEIPRTIGNAGKACIGFGESLDAGNPELDAVRKALKSPLFIEDIGKAKKILLVFVVGRREFVNMMEINEAAEFLLELFNPDPEDVGALLSQTLIDETFGDGVTAFVLATNFDFGNGEDEFRDKFFSGIKIVGIGATGANALNYFGDVADDIFPARLIIADKDADLQAKISKFIIDETCWMFVIADVEDLNFAAQVTKIIEQSNLLITSLILCPTASDVRLADIPDSFGTWIILPEDKIAETGLTKNAAIYKAVNMTTSIIPIMKKRANFIGMDFAEIPRTIGNFGRACIGFGESLDAENNPVQAVKNALQSPLFIEDIRHAKKALLVFFGGVEFLNMLEMNEAFTFLDELRQADWGYTLWQVDVDEPFDKDGVAAFVLATNF